VLRRLAAGLAGGHLVFFDTLPLARALLRGGARLIDLAPALESTPALAPRARRRGHLARCSASWARAPGAGAKSVLVNLLDNLGLALALEGGGRTVREKATLFDLARRYTLGRSARRWDLRRRARRLAVRRSPWSRSSSAGWAVAI